MILDTFKLLNLLRDEVGPEAVLNFILFSPIKDAFKLSYVNLQMLSVAYANDSINVFSTF